MNTHNNSNVTSQAPFVNKSHWTLRPLANMLRSRLLGWSGNKLASVAVKSWEIAPSETTISPSAFYLPNQLERVTDWAFTSEHPHREMEGGITSEHSPTNAYLLKDAWLIDGTLLKDNSCTYLQPRVRKLPQFRAPFEIAQAAIYSTPGGIQYFGQWLMDDCVTYPLAASLGTPVSAIKKLVSTHTHEYKKLLGMSPTFYENVFFKELIIFEDVGQNRSKHNRFRANSEKLLTSVRSNLHPGVFILRGTNGMPRTLKNELAIAEHLRSTRGFRILDPMKSDVATIIETCAGAQAVIGVEGSQLIHGVMTLQENCALLTLQPPNRFVSVFKHLTDRDHQHFGFVVGMPDGDGFYISIEEVERTLDLFPKSHG